MILRFIFAALAMTTAVLHPRPAHAEWLSASSAHFVVYADDSESDLRKFSERLERYHSAMALVTGAGFDAPSPSNRVTIFIVKNVATVRRLSGKGSRYVSGFYLPRAAGSVAIIPPVNNSFSTPDLSMTILLHEYAHHFAISASSNAMPRWITEGQAEFFASARFDADGGMGIGLAANHRAGEFLYAPDVTAGDLLDPSEYEKRAGKNYDAFYGKSWLLYHYLTFEPARQGQMARYLALLGQGKSQREAGLEAFGDFRTLEKDIDKYLQRRQIVALKIPPSKLKVTPVEVRKLSAGEAAMMPVIVQSKRGVTSEQAKALVVEAREITAGYPKDPAALAALAEAEHDADNHHAAIAAADAAIAIDPGQINAHVQKGLALFDLAVDASDQPKAFVEVRRAFAILNRREFDHPLPLIYYFRSFEAEGTEAPPLAIDGLIRAMQVAPFDFPLRMTLGTQLIKAGRQKEAWIVLSPVAFNPHGGGLADAARRVLDRLDAEPGWTGQGVEALTARREGDPEESED